MACVPLRAGISSRLLPVLAWFVAVCNAVVPFDSPFQIVRPTPDHKSMTVVSEGLAKLQEHDVGISLLSVVGPYHSGKSFLLNSLLQNMKAFMVGRHTTPETMGIWLCRTSLKAADGTEVWLMDSEGFFGPGVDEAYDAKVFTMASLLGSHLVYNTVKIIDQHAVNLLELLMTQAQLFGSRSSVLATVPVPEFLAADSFPPLTWVVEDFVQELPQAFKQEGPIGYLTTYLQGSSGVQEGSSSLATKGNETRETVISKTFRDVKVAHLFLPATSKAQLQDLSQLTWSELTEEYRAEVDILRGHVLQNIKARELGGKKATGPALARALHFSVQALQQGMFQELPSLWTSWTTQVAQMSLEDADEWFSSLLRDVDRDEDPTPLASFNGQVELARERATGFYRHLIRDFKVRPQMGELRQRMDRHFDRKLQTYHERTRRWVMELLAQAKETFAKYLSSLALPMDPAALDKLGKSSGEELTQNLTAKIKAFSASGRRVTLGAAANMPIFSQAPATQLANDFRAQLGARALENDREVERVFKSAAVAADEAVDSELRGSGEALLGQARMDQIVKNAEVACFRAFDGQLGAKPWAARIAKYQSAKTQVRKEAFEARVARFTAAHAKRLGAHMQTGLQSALASYKERASSVSMPAPQADIDAQHAQLASATQEFLADYARTLTDTKAFKEMSGQLSSLMADGLKQLQEKNVELWKVYSDGATRCAAAANSQRARDCGFVCLFNNLPWWHRSISRRHLSACFAKDAVGSRMSPQLQAQVFEVWYTKDLGQATGWVRNRFIMLSITSLAVCASAWWYFRGRHMYYRYGYSPMRGNVYQQQMNPQGVWRGTGYGQQQTGFGLQSNTCYGQQQQSSLYAQQAAQSQFGVPAVSQRRGFFGA